MLGLERLAVVEVEVLEDGSRVVHVATLDEAAAACPTCGVISTQRKALSGHPDNPFHLVALANQSITEVRQHATRAARGRRGRKRDPEWAAHRRLLLAHERHSDEAFTRMWNALIDAGRPGVKVLAAYTVKEDLRALLALPPGADREAISHRLWRFYAGAAASSSPEVHRLAETIESRWPAVLAALTTGYTNARCWGAPPACGGGLQPPGQARRPQRLRLPQPAQPATPDTLDLHPPTPAADSHEDRPARLTSKSRITGVTRRRRHLGSEWGRR